MVGDALLHAREKRTAIDAHKVHPGDIAAGDADYVKHRGQEGNRNQRCQQFGRDKVAERIDGHALKCVDLLGNAHDAYLGAHRRSGAARHHQRGQHRPEFHDQGQGHRAAEHALGPELVQRIVALQAQHHARGQSGEKDNRERSGADEAHLLEQFPKAERMLAEACQGQKKKDAHPTKIGQDIEGLIAQRGQGSQRRSCFPCGLVHEEKIGTTRR